MVLTIHVVRQGGHHYYVHDLVPGRAEDGRVAGEEPGAWTGAGAASLGLWGQVASPAFAEVLAGRHPLSGQALRAARGERSVAGYDLTFCAPKSVSLLHLLAPREIAEAAGVGHHRAVADAVGYLGREGIGVRRSRDGRTSFLPTTGPVAGQFLHRTSRALDPHLHTHVVVANVAEGVDGAWSSVDSRRLHAHLGAAQALYHARMRGELGVRMGARWLLRPSGLADVDGVDPGLCRLFSRRSASMDEHRQRLGSTGAGAGRSAAFHADRPDKDRGITVDALMTEWKRRAADLGFDLGELTRCVGERRAQRELEVDRSLLRRRILGLTAEHTVVGRHHLVAALAASTEGGAGARAIEMAADGLMEACGSPTGAAVGDGRGVIGGRWDPAHVVRVVDGLPFGGEWGSAGAAPTGRPLSELVTASFPELARAETNPRLPTAPGIMIDGPTGRLRKVGAPSAMTRSLGIGR